MGNVEALEWLKSNKNDSAFCTDRFGDTCNAIEFVENLYELGVTNVSICCIHDELWRIEQEGGPYGVGLYVYLPRNVKKREWIIELHKKEVEEYGMEQDGNFNKRVDNILEFFWD